MRLGMIGYGGIGAHVAATIAAGGAPGVDLGSVLVRTERPTPADAPGLTNDPERFFADRCDAVLEGAGHDAVRTHGQRTLDNGADLLVTSIGVFAAEPPLLDRLTAAARANGRRLILPAAGIGAIDMLSAAAVGGLDSVTVTVRKDPPAWKGTPAENLVNLDALKVPTTIFDGPVREGAATYPQNVNISACAAIAGIGLDRTRLIIVADPTITTHIVEVEAKGAFGSFRFVEDVLPTIENPKTGRIVAMAVVKTVRQLASPLVVGW
jgi:aspartate dehydrogenase